MKLVVATSNRGKAVELQALLAPLGYEVLLPSDVGITLEVVEDAPTFLANAEKKARAYHEATGLAALGDDSGLAVDALHGGPGVLSARYAGPGHGDRANNDKLLRELDQVADPLRTARFCCALALITRAGTLFTAEGKCEGTLLRAPRGASGFGYDPLFFVPALGRTLAELSTEEKNRISHRSQALQALCQTLSAATADLV